MKKPTTLYQLVEQSAAAALSVQTDDGAMPPGHNGPYHDPETPVRNTAHWLITWLKAYHLTGNANYLQAVERAVNYLTSPVARPMQATFLCRKNPDKDFANGLVGQAWVIEALVSAAQQLAREDLWQLAEDLFMLHPYDETAGGWRKVNVDGSYGRMDYTFNHQLWFAAAGALIVQQRASPVAASVADFMNRLNRHLSIYRSGLIRHRSGWFLGVGWHREAARGLFAIYNFRDARYMHMKSLGYHGFNLYGFSLLHTVFPEHPFWQNRKFRAALQYAQQDSFFKAVAGSKYGYPYNPPGFEIPFALQQFGLGSPTVCANWIQEQLDRAFDFEQALMQRNTPDPVTLAARLYEAARLEDYPIS